MAKPSFSSGDPRFLNTKRKLERWLVAEGYSLTEQAVDGAAWFFVASDPQHRPVMIGQRLREPDAVRIEAVIEIGNEERSLLARIGEEKRESVLWDLRFRILAAELDCRGVDHPLELIALGDAVFVEDLHRTDFMRVMRRMRLGIAAVIWTLNKELRQSARPFEAPGLAN